MTLPKQAGAALSAPAAGRFVPATEPYPWPYDGILTGSRLALVVAGAQRWWVERTTQPMAALDAVARLRQAARAAGALVLVVDHVAGPGGRQSRRVVPAHDHPGADSALRPDLGEVVVTAAGLDGFYGSALDATLRSAGRDRLLLAGLGLEGPVHSTLRSANDRGYECLLVADACSCVDPGLRAGAINSVLMSGGIFGAVGRVEAVCAGLPKNNAAKEVSL
jgi:nicotinamidase-related amidase